MLVMPYAVDQPDNAERVRRLGIARVLARKKYSAATAARELDLLLSSPRYTQAAAAIGLRVSSEDGAAVTCDCLQPYLDEDRGRIR